MSRTIEAITKHRGIPSEKKQTMKAVRVHKHGGPEVLQYEDAPRPQVAAGGEVLIRVYAAGVNPADCAIRAAWNALFNTAQLQPSQRVLIHGGAGGVGHFAVQPAKQKGAHVIATASAKNHELVYELGADEVIDYQAQKFEDVARKIDISIRSHTRKNGSASLERKRDRRKER